MLNKGYILLLAGSLVALTYTFRFKENSKRYGFISQTIKSETLYYYTAVDLDVLEKLNISYGCRRGGAYCEIEVDLKNIRTVRNGPNKEFIEFAIDPKFVKILGKGLSFFIAY